MNEISKNQEAWMKLYEKCNILSNIEKNKYFEIEANQIKEFREARLMTKFDHRINLPKIFSKNNV